MQNALPYGRGYMGDGAEFDSGIIYALIQTVQVFLRRVIDLEDDVKRRHRTLHGRVARLEEEVPYLWQEVIHLIMREMDRERENVPQYDERYREQEEEDKEEKREEETKDQQEEQVDQGIEEGKEESKEEGKEE